MVFHRGVAPRILSLLAVACAALAAAAQSGNAGSVHGTVTDPSGAVVPNATIHLTNAVTGFAPSSRNFEIRSSVETTLTLVLQIAGASQTVTVESAGPEVEDTSTYHT